MKKLAQFSLVLVFGLGLLNYGAITFAQAPDTKTAVCEGVGLTGGTGCDEPAGGPTVGSIVKSVVGILSLIIGFVSVIMIIIGGFKYITSNGDSNSISSAKNTIIYALVGLAIVVLAQFIVRFVLVKVSVP